MRLIRLLPATALALLAACQPMAEGPGSAETLPQPFRGDWGINAADCAGGAAAKGLMTVSATELRFYESRGQLSGPLQTEDDAVTGSFAFTGEGQRWTRTERLALSDGGSTLTRTESGGGDLPGPLTYRRCP